MDQSEIVKKDIKKFIFNNVSKHPSDIVTYTSTKLNISKSSIRNYISELVESSYLEKEGSGRGIKYKVGFINNILKFDKVSELEEDIVWSESIKPNLADVSQSIIDICQYGSTEIINNAIDHSDSIKMTVVIQETYTSYTIFIVDFGIGIFKKIQNELGLSNPRFSILELAKGKYTSDPANHTGEGIFFTSRMFDYFQINSDNLTFNSHDGVDILFEIDDIGNKRGKGTIVMMGILKDSKTNMEEVFNEFADPDKIPGFHKTCIPLELASCEGDKLISRSQAKRVLARIEKFTEVILDFNNVDTIGQAFADQIFRVFTIAHPEVHLMPINTNLSIENMIKHVSNGQIP